MITQTGVYGRLQSTELLGHSLFHERTDTAIDNITCYQDEIRFLLIDHVNPSGQFFPGVVIAQMQIARHHDLICPRQRL